jgi:TolA-binding protein
MNKFKIYLLALILPWGINQTFAIDSQIKQADDQIKILEKLAQEWVDRYNQLLKLKSEGQVSEVTGPTPHIISTLPVEGGNPALTKTIEDLQARLQDLEKRLGEPHQTARPIDIEREKAQEKAQTAAPFMNVESPARAQYESALVLFDKKEFKKAHESFKLIVEQFSQDYFAPLSRLHMAVCDHSLGNYQEALNGFIEAEKLDLPEDKKNTARLGIVECKLALNRDSEACKELREIKPEHLTEEQKERFKTAKAKIVCPAPKEPEKA